MLDLVIIGGGPGGTSAAVYAARKQLKSVLLTEAFGGQSIVSPGIQNWIGTIEIPGDELAKSFKAHAEAYSGEFLEIKEGQKAKEVRRADGEGFMVVSESGDEYHTKAVLVTTGSHRRKLPVEGADRLEHKGITYCATCDGPIFSGQDVAVIGGGNAGFETAAQLLAYTKSVTLLDFGEAFKADPITVTKVLEHENMTGIPNSETLEVIGDKFVTGLKYKDRATGEEKMLNVTGVFVEIGAVPSSGFLGDLVDLTDYKQVKVDPRNQRTSVEGIWAAGDVTDGLYHQNNIAAGDAVKALEDIYMWVKAR